MAIAGGLAAFFATELGKQVGKAALDIGVNAVNNRIAKNNAKDQREWQEEMWHNQNAYNSPVMMAFRMRQAGLNPYAMTGAEPAGSAGTGATAETHPYRSPLDSIAQAASISNLNADTQKKREEAEAARLNNMNLAVDVNNKAEYVRLYLQKYEEEIGLTKAQRLKYEAEAEEAFERARQLKEYGANGGNTFGDSGAVAQSTARLNDSFTALNTAKTEYQNILNLNADAQQKAEIKQKLAAAQKSVAEALAAEMSAVYTDTLNKNATEQEARNAALHVYEKALLQYQSNTAYQESVIRHMQAMREEVKTKNPFTDKRPEGFFPFVFYNLFGEDGMLSF